MLAVLVSGVIASILVSVAGAAPIPSSAHVTSFPQPDTPPTGGDGQLVFGPDGQAWFTGYYSEAGAPGEEPRYLPQIMRIDGQGNVGVVFEHKNANGFAVGPDGNVWLTNSRGLSRLTPAGQLTEFPLPEEKFGQDFTQAAGPIVIGSDGNFWFSGYRAVPNGSEGKAVATIDRMTPSGQVTQFDLSGPGSFPTRLTEGPEGNVWFTEASVSKVGRISPAGEIQMFQLPPESRPVEIVRGADGNLWVTEEKTPVALARITPTGEYTEFKTELEFGPGSLVAGPDGRLWFAAGPGEVARMTPGGRVSVVHLPNATGVIDLVAGADGNLWYTAAPEPPCAPGDSACGQAGNYTSGIVGRIEPAPLGLTIEGAAPAAKGRRAKVRLTCHDGLATDVCRGRLSLRAGSTVIARHRFQLGTDLARTVSVRLSREGRERLARRGHLRVVCEVEVAGAEPAKLPTKLKLPRH
jgi:virginiamycin B lyase